MADKFVAHSVVMTSDPRLMTAPSVNWKKLSKFAKSEIREVKEDVSDADRAILKSVATELLPEYWNAMSDNAVVALSSGTVILASKLQPGPKFVGFTPKRIPAGSIAHSLPPHRFEDGATGAAEQLIGAQIHYDSYVIEHPDHAKYIDDAFSKLNVIGYPNAGQSGADTNVVAMWYRQGSDASKNEWVVLVKCVCTNRVQMGVTVIMTLEKDRMPDSAEFMKDLADAGRNMFREEFIIPRILGCYPVNVKKPEPAAPTPNTAAPLQHAAE